VVAYATVEVAYATSFSPTARESRMRTATSAPKLLLTAVEAAEQLGVSRTKVYELMAAGMLRSIHIGRLRRVPVDALRDFIGEMELR
jgi:excisionase family DNA binding protein